MSHESIAKMAKCSQKMIDMIAKEVEINFVPRKEFFTFIFLNPKLVIYNTDEISRHPCVPPQKVWTIPYHMDHIIWSIIYDIGLDDVPFIMKTLLKIRIRNVGMRAFDGKGKNKSVAKRAQNTKGNSVMVFKLRNFFSTHVISPSQVK